MKVADILKVKGSAVKTVRPTESIETLAHRLRAEGVGALVVSKDGQHVDGIISERDLVRAIAEHGAEALGRSVSDHMTRGVYSCRLTDKIVDVGQTMTQRRIRHLPVIDEGRLAGIVSAGDVMKSRLDEMEMEANVLRDYAIAHN